MRILLPGRYEVRDVVTGEEIARDASEIIFQLDPPETRVFLLRSN